MYRYLVAEGNDFFTTTEEPDLYANDTIFRVSKELNIEYWDGSLLKGFCVFKKLHELATLPTRAKNEDAGLDLYAIEEIEVPGMMALHARCMEELIAMIQEKKYIPKHKIPELFSLEACTHRFRTGVALSIPSVTYSFWKDDVELKDVSVGLLWDKSGLGDRCIHRLGGVIDYGYRGEILVRMINFGMESWIVTPGTKICQIILQPILYFPDSLITWSSDLSETERGSDGFGSSGR